MYRYIAQVSAPDWFTETLGWKAASKKATPRCNRLFGEAYGPNLADLSSTSSAAIAGRVYAILGIPQSKRSTIDLTAVDATTLSASGTELEDALESAIQSSTGTALERGLESDIATGLHALGDDRGWRVTRSGSVGQFAQYSHLAELQRLFLELPTLRSTLGQDYEVATDVMVSLPDPTDAVRPRVLHAAVSSKLTIRSDRVQNIRYEFGTLVRNRKGRLPHLVVVTAEPLPSRLVSIARGTGEIDAVYHLLFDEMEVTTAEDRLTGVAPQAWQEQRSNWREMVGQKRIRPYSELVAVLAAG